jgi:hypothetical protein
VNRIEVTAVRGNQLINNHFHFNAFAAIPVHSQAEHTVQAALALEYVGAVCSIYLISFLSSEV